MMCSTATTYLTCDPCVQTEFKVLEARNPVQQRKDMPEFAFECA